MRAPPQRFVLFLREVSEYQALASSHHPAAVALLERAET
jgi:hypothetical protein